jgi:FAD/FMN-containing dehydrogenase
LTGSDRSKYVPPMQTRAEGATLPESALRELGRSLEGDVLLPGDDAYDAARRVWNAMVDRRPAVIARCAGPADVGAAIRFARLHGLEIGVRGGGHSILGQSLADGGLTIDLSLLGGVIVDPGRRLARVGGGALLGSLDRASLEHGLATTAGNVSHTGVGGLTLGGGMGWLARQFGLACDNVVEYQLVTADGSQLRVTAEENADLFWGLRGGGGNFGVVTEFTFRLHPFAGQALSVDAYYPAAAGREVLAAWRDFALAAPDEATPTAWVGTSGEWPFLAPEHHNQPLVNAGFVWAGDPEMGRRLATALHDIGPVVGEEVEEIPYLTLQTWGDEGNRHGLRRYWKGHYLEDIGPSAIDAFLSRGGAAPDGGIVPNGFLQAYGGAIGRVGIEESAFSHRNTRFEFVVMAGWEDPAEDETRMGAARRFAAAMESDASGVYVNALSDEGAAGVAHAYRDATLERLRVLKDRYDPDNAFHLNHNIAPSGVA